MERHYATVWEAAADVLGDAPAIVQGEHTVTWSRFEDDAARLASALLEAGTRQGDRVGLLLRDGPELLIAAFAALKIRAVPINLHPRYERDELAYLLHDATPAVVVAHAERTATLAAAIEQAGPAPAVVAVPDATGEGVLGEVWDQVLLDHEPAARMSRSEDDEVVLYTGGTTGRPKGVVSTVGVKVLSDLAGATDLLGDPTLDPDVALAHAAARVARGDRYVMVVAAPMTHGTGYQIGALPALTVGGVVALPPPGTFDPQAVWDTAASTRALGVVLVGDPMARPLADALDARPRDLPALRVIASSGAMFSQRTKERLVGALRHVRVMDILGSSEVSLGSSEHTWADGAPTGRFHPFPGVVLIGDDGTVLGPGDGIGELAAPGGPRRYRGDEDATARLFRTIDGVRYALSGDRARMHQDGSIELLGRGSSVINSGGEKVHAEEVEEAVKAVEGVQDCIVVGVPDERFGSVVGAVVSPGDLDAAALQAALGVRLSSFKVPKVVVPLEAVPRHSTGKADLARAAELLRAAHRGDRG